jgi:SnoaL-like polyketide cyclase
VVKSKAVDTIRAAVLALNDGDVDGYLRHFAPSCPRWVPGLEQPLTLTEISDNFRLLRDAFEGLHLGADLLFGDDEFACAHWRLRGVHVREYLGHAPKGRAIDTQTCEVYQVSGGLVITSWVHGDLGELFRQINSDQ